MIKLTDLLEHQSLTKSELRNAYGQPNFEDALADALATGKIVKSGMLSEFKRLQPGEMDEPIYISA